VPVRKVAISQDGIYSAFWCELCEARMHSQRPEASRRATDTLSSPRGGGADDEPAPDDDESLTASPPPAPVSASPLTGPGNASGMRSGEWRSAKPSVDAQTSPRDDAGGGLGLGDSRLAVARRTTPTDTSDDDATALDDTKGSLRHKRRGGKGASSLTLSTSLVAPPLPDGTDGRYMPPPLPKSPGRAQADGAAPPQRPAPTPKRGGDVGDVDTTDSDSSSAAATNSMSASGNSTSNSFNNGSINANSSGAGNGNQGSSNTSNANASLTSSLDAAGGAKSPLPIQKLSTMTREERRKALQEAAKARPKRVDKWGFQVDTLKAQRNQSAKEREKEAERAEKWAPMIAEWDRFWNKQRAQTKDRFRKGLPDTLRGPLWRLVTNSDALRNDQVGLYARLSRQESPTFGSQIARDIHRTFPEHVYFKDGAGLGQVGLQKILNAFALYDEATGYTQGMGFVAGLLLIYMGEEDAFFTLVRLMTDYELAGLYSPGFPRLYEMFHVHTQLLRQHLPQVAAHFESLELDTKTYGFQWFSTLYLYALPFHLVIRIWDYFLVDRFVAVYGIALALLKIHQQRLLQLEWEGVMELLFAFNELEIDAEVLISTALEFKLKDDLLQKHSLAYHKLAAQGKLEEETARREEELKRLVAESINAVPTLSSPDAPDVAAAAAASATIASPKVVPVPIDPDTDTEEEHHDFDDNDDDDDDDDDDDSPLPPPAEEPAPKSPPRSSAKRASRASRHREHKSRHKSSSSKPSEERK
jgi:hypothetical protein